MKSFKQFIHEEKSSYIGQCDKVRCDSKGESFWQNMMSTKKKITQREFLKHIDPSRILDDGESFDEWVSYHKQEDDTMGFYKSSDNIYFIQVAGFEYIWKSNE